ncbi:cyclin-dependent kinase 5 activator 1-like [Spea bombifrons]|uniref:cyclin-dependent kinase 5 activator 1-like n=1 Tax=Spea bombifrons TaxID=233779 RepID=UPI00234AE7A3|nr:cyclin-dependent kinase 5 activator 1-like [Spea bombifrons]
MRTVTSMSFKSNKTRLCEDDVYDGRDYWFMAAQSNNISSGTSGMPLKQRANTIRPQVDEEEDISAQLADPDPESNWALEKIATNKLLQWLGNFIHRRCFRLIFLTPEEPVAWIRSVERELIADKWQTDRFLIPSNIIFLYMICRDVISSRVTTKQELREILMICLYVTYSYAGPEISYPAKYFRRGARNEDFWDKCLSVIGSLSGEMVRINNDPIFYAKTFASLKAKGGR